MTRPIPRQPVPALEIPTVGGGAWRLSDRKPENFTMIVVYRGLHCPVCSKYLGDLESKLDAFRKRGVEVIVISSDSGERAAEAKQKWNLANLTVGYGLSFESARKWGLYFSHGVGKTSIGIEEPEVFVEPGLFLVRPDGTLYYNAVQTMPFARPAFGDILMALDFVLAKGYPARGEAIQLPQAAE